MKRIPKPRSISYSEFVSTPSAISIIPQFPADLAERPHDRLHRIVRLNPLDQLPIDLHHIRRTRRQRIQPRVARTKVVDSDHNPTRTMVTDNLRITIAVRLNVF
jgi:hypothetical protein